MPDATSLREQLRHLDGTAQSIQGAAAAMMKHYDKSAAVAANEWRNSLQSATHDQLLPLLYVINETLQTSKRNRGFKFLEVLSPVLGQSLKHICMKASGDAAMVEKVRRTVKIWGDRRVFSIRFVNELLMGLEPYRHGKGGSADADDEARFSPAHSAPASSNAFSPSSTRKVLTSSSALSPQVAQKPDDDDNDDDIMDILEDDHKYDSGDDNSLFESQSEGLNLEIDMNVVGQPNKDDSKKRRRGSLASATSQSSHSSRNKRKRKSTVLSTNNLMELWNRLSNVQQTAEYAQLTLEKIDSSIAKTPEAELENLVGDELQQQFRQCIDYQKQIYTQRRQLFTVAQERHAVENEVEKQYLPWLEKAMKQDDEDTDFCDRLELKLLSFRNNIHGPVVAARSVRLAEEERQRVAQQERDRKQKEAEEAEKFRKAAMAKETEAKPGMVWNPSTREYQSLNTNEDWRD